MRDRAPHTVNENDLEKVELNRRGLILDGEQAKIGYVASPGDERLAFGVDQVNDQLFECAYTVRLQKLLVRRQFAVNCRRIVKANETLYKAVLFDLVLESFRVVMLDFGETLEKVNMLD